MLIYLLLIIFIILIYLVYRLFDRDLVCPSFLLVSGYTLSVLCATANISEWGIDLHWKTLGVLTFGTGLFILTAYVVKKYWEKSYSDNFVDIEQIQPIRYNQKYLKYFCIFQVVVIVVWVHGIFQITSELGEYSNFSERMMAFRIYSSYSNKWLSNLTLQILNQFVQISVNAIYIYLYIMTIIFYRNKCNIKEYLRIIRDNLYLLLGIICSVFQILLLGGRLDVIGLVIYCCVLLAIFYKKENKVCYNISFKRFITFLVFSIFGAILFYISKVIVGRGINDISLHNFVPYITMYAGGPIQLLDMFLVNPIVQSDIWGKETFYSLNFFLARVGLVNFEPYIVHLEFRNAITGAFLGNIYTAYRSYIYDFGFIGLTILPLIFSLITNSIYYKKIYCGISKNIDFGILIYGILSLAIFCDFVRCFFYLNIVSIGFYKKLFIIWIISKILIQGKEREKEAI